MVVKATIRLDKMPHLMAIIRQLKKRKIAVGIFDSKNASKAYKMEYGDPTNKPGPIPPRPFMRRAIQNMPTVKVSFIELWAKGVKNSLNEVGLQFVDVIKKSIDDAKFWAMPLRPYTVRKKGHDEPLKDTLEMYNSIKVLIK